MNDKKQEISDSKQKINDFFKELFKDLDPYDYEGAMKRWESVLIEMKNEGKIQVKVK